MTNRKILYRLGLKEYQSKTLTALMKKGDMTAQKISEESTVPYSKIYTVLKSLQDMGLVVSTEERPQRYIPRNGEHVVNFLISRKESELSRIRREASRAKEKLCTMKSIDMTNTMYQQKTL